jgi:hypothetical protein
VGATLRAVQAPEIRPRSIADVIDVVFRIFLDSFAPLVTITAVVTGPILLLQGVIQLTVFNDVAATDVNDIENLGDLFSAEQLSATVVLGILGWAASSLASGAVVRAVADIHLGRSVDWRASIRHAMTFLGPLLLGSFLFAAGVSVGFVLLVIPGIFLAITWVVFSPAIVIEDQGAVRSLSRSWELVSGRRWPTLGVFIVFFLLTGLVSSVLSRILSFGSGFTFADVVVTTAIGVVLAPITAITVVVIYLDLRARKEDYDAVALETDLATGPTSPGPDSIIR